MRVFLDTNILLDIVEKRIPFHASSQAVLDRCDELEFDIFVAWHGIATVFYITAKKQSEAYATIMIRSLLSWATVSTVGHEDARDALAYGISDYEDALQAAAARASLADWLVTRDALGFTGSPVAAIRPDDFLAKHPVPAGNPAQ